MTQLWAAYGGGLTCGLVRKCIFITFDRELSHDLLSRILVLTSECMREILPTFVAKAQRSYKGFERFVSKI